MKEMWDYESQEPFLGKARGVTDTVPEKFKDLQLKSKIECELCGGNHEVEQCPHEESLVQEWIPLVLTQRINFLMVRVKVVDYLKSQWKWPIIRRPAQSVNGKTNPIGYCHVRDRLTPENLLELDPRKRPIGDGP